MASSIATFFGFSSMPRVSKQDRAILDMKNQRDKLKVYQRKIQTILDQEHRIAKEALRNGDQEKARRALRRRRYQETLLEQTYGQLETLEQLVASVEFSLIEVSVMHGLQQGNKVLSEIHNEMNIENVEKLMSETQEALAYQREIDEMLSSKMNADEEEAVMKELAGLQAELAPASTIQLPDAPVSEPATILEDPVVTTQTTTIVAQQEERVALPA